MVTITYFQGWTHEKVEYPSIAAAMAGAKRRLGGKVTRCYPSRDLRPVFELRCGDKVVGSGYWGPADQD